MAKRKTFEPGAAVEVQRIPGGPWLSCTYVGPWAMRDSHIGYHRVKGDSLIHYIDSMSGVETTEKNPRAYKTDTDLIPANRIRARVTWIGGHCRQVAE